MNILKAILTAAAVAASAAALQASAQQDHEFLIGAAQAGMAEVELGRIARDKATNPAVKRFASRMVEDHAKVNAELQKLAAARKVKLPTTLSGQHRASADTLARVSGSELDRIYMQHMVTDHTKAVAEFERAAKDAKDAEVKAFAAKTLPTLQEHLKMAETTAQGLGAGKAGAATSSGATPNTGGSGSGSAPPTETKGRAGK